ncbi:MAG: SDR family NAD(P)-dependent oxidoreductase [Burkholderiales bacterium]|nr:SDR family NAD(P)-dependent oxidoreductase [Burkholderiales bacterium]
MKLYVVTGSSSGLGLSLVRRLAAQPDAEVIGVSRRAIDVPNVRSIQLDLSDPLAVVPGIQAALAGCRLPQYAEAVLFNNAGIVAPVAPLVRLDAAQLDINLRTNLVGPMLVMRAFIEATDGRARKRVIVNVSSGAGRRPVSGWSAYCASKAGLDMATRVAALEAPPGLVICSLAPGVIDTPMQETIRDSKTEDFPDLARFQAMMAEGTLRPADDVARIILQHIEQGSFKHGALHDLREMA